MRKGNGLGVINIGEVDCITIAGMGGKLIRDILDEGQKKLVGIKRLILQPNVSAKAIRIWLRQHDFELINEKILEEDEKIYEVLVAEKGNANAPYQENEEASLLLGPFLRKEKNETFIKKWSFELEKWLKIRNQLDQAVDSSEINSKKEQLDKKIQLVKEELNV